jgi:hypothetical protein
MVEKRGNKSFVALRRFRPRLSTLPQPFTESAPFLRLALPGAESYTEPTAETPGSRREPQRRFFPIRRNRCSLQVSILQRIAKGTQLVAVLA